MNTRSTVRCESAAFPIVFSNYPIYNEIFTHLSAASVVRFGRINRVARLATSDYLQSALHINRFLARFFKDPLGFRSLQARTGLLISGSAALQFFDRSYWPESDLDLYAAPRTALQIGNWLMDEEGYEFRPNSVQSKKFEKAVGFSQHRIASRLPWPTNAEPLEDLDAQTQVDHRHLRTYNLLGIFAVYTFIAQPSVQFPHPRKVQIMQASLSNLQCILRFHNSKFSS
jgi:hypothetical protein